MKYKIIYLFLLIQTLLFAQNMDNNVTDISPDELVIIKDKSGLSDDEIRDVAKETDTYKKRNKISISEVLDNINEEGELDVSILQSTWKELSPTPKKYDWVQTKSGEWFKGDIKAMYDDNLEFDSDEIGIYTFNFEDIAQIKSYNILSTNIEGLASFEGVVRLKNSNLTIIQGDTVFNFQRDQIVSFAKSGDNELSFWSGKITLNLDIRSGNKNQFDYTAQGYLLRRSSTTRLRFDYLGRMTSVDYVETAKDHRFNEQYDIYITKGFYWTPVFSEFYNDKFQNIESQYTAGIGIGYTIIKSKILEWNLSGGPAYKSTKYYTVADGEDKSVTSPSLEIGTIIEYELTSKNDINLNAKMTFTDNDNGKYKHHIILKLENELLSWLDFDITGIWDRTQKPGANEFDEIPDQDDYQFLVGIGVEF